jgi:CHASE2 domain-containing sensor protein
LLETCVPIPVKSLIISWRTIALALLLSVIVGISGAGELPDRMISMATSRIAARPVSGDTVIVALDDKTLQAIGGRDFDIDHHTQLIRALDASPARRLFIDFSYERRLRDREFPEFAAAVRHMGPRIVLARSIGQLRGPYRQTAGVAR